MRKNLNVEKIQGYVYQIGSNGKDALTKKTSGPESKNPGTEYIAGTIEIAVDEEGLNIIPVHFSYVTPTYSSGKENRNYKVLCQLLDNPKTWLTDGKESALKVKVDASLGLSEFIAQDGTLASIKRNEGSFINIVSSLDDVKERNTFKEDMLITKVTHVEADEEKHIAEDYVNITGYIFDFRNAVMPVTFTVRNDLGMKYFESLDASEGNPIYTQVWGKINCLSETVSYTEVSAFGEDLVSTREKKSKEWLVTGTAKEMYVFDDEKSITKDELKAALQNREVLLADIQKRYDDKANGTGAGLPTFNF